jgi:hypothetical protein
MPNDIQYLNVLGKIITPVFWHLLHDYHFGGCSQKLTFNTFSPTEYTYSAASHASHPDGVLVLRNFHKVVK